MIDGLTNDTTANVLQRMLQFAGQRQQLIANNIANVDTPGFRPADVDVAAFQRQLQEAVERRRSPGGSAAGELSLQSTSQVEASSDGLILHPEPSGRNILFHDGNDRNVERQMQDLVENFQTYRAAVQLLRNRFEMINAAIRERP